MALLIVESNPELAGLWRLHIDRHGWQVRIAPDQASAIRVLQGPRIDAVLLDLVIDGGSAFAVADYAAYRHPDVPVVIVTHAPVFSDGSIFAHVSNARAFLPAGTPPADLALLVDHYARRPTPRAAPPGRAGHRSP